MQWLSHIVVYHTKLNQNKKFNIFKDLKTISNAKNVLVTLMYLK